MMEKVCLVGLLCFTVASADVADGPNCLDVVLIIADDPAWDA